MKEKTIDLELPSGSPEDTERECHMSLELYQNARQTMGELRDVIRQTGMSWDFIQSQIERSQPTDTPVERILDRLDDYSTGLGKSLHDKKSNVR